MESLARVTPSTSSRPAREEGVVIANEGTPRSRWLLSQGTKTDSGESGGAAGGAAAVKRAGVRSNAVKSDEMEDFGGLPRGVLQKK